MFVSPSVQDHYSSDSLPVVVADTVHIHAYIFICTHATTFSTDIEQKQLIIKREFFFPFLFFFEIIGEMS